MPTPLAPVRSLNSSVGSVKAGDEVVTAGWRASGLSSLYPKGIPIGKVTSVGQTDTDLYQQVQVDPFADFGSLDAVLVLVPGGMGFRGIHALFERDTLTGVETVFAMFVVATGIAAGLLIANALVSARRSL